MEKSIIIIGMGPCLSMGIAEKFGSEGFSIGMISRNENKLSGFQYHLKNLGIESFFARADVSVEADLKAAIQQLKVQLPPVHILQYNAVDYRIKPILEEHTEDLATGFKISVANVLVAVKELMEDLKKSQGAILLTGGGAALEPDANMGSISLGKAGIRSLAYQLHQVLKPAGIYTGTVTICGWINPESATHSPKILAEKFWQLNVERKETEIIY